MCEVWWRGVLRERECRVGLSIVGTRDSTNRKTWYRDSTNGRLGKLPSLITDLVTLTLALTPTEGATVNRRGRSGERIARRPTRHSSTHYGVHSSTHYDVHSTTR